MTKILELLIAVVIILLIYRLAFTLTKRVILIFKLEGLRKLDGVEVECVSPPLLSLVFLSEKPEYIVKLDGITYLVRTYNGGGAASVVHFASENFTVRFSRMKNSTHRGARGFVTIKGGFALGSKVKILPKLKHEEAKLEKTQIREALILNPAPCEVSYVTEKKTSIRVAFTGDKVYGTEIFTATTFVNHIERESRRIRMERRAAK